MLKLMGLFAGQWLKLELEEVLNVGEAAILLRLHHVTVRKLASDKKLPARKVGREWRFNRASLLGWLNGDFERAETWQSEKIKKLEFGKSTYQLMEGRASSALASQRLKKTRKNSTAALKMKSGGK